MKSLFYMSTLEIPRKHVSAYLGNEALHISRTTKINKEVREA